GSRCVASLDAMVAFPEPNLARNAGGVLGADPDRVLDRHRGVRRHPYLSTGAEYLHLSAERCCRGAGSPYGYPHRSFRSEERRVGKECRFRWLRYRSIEI